MQIQLEYTPGAPIQFTVAFTISRQGTTDVILARASSNGLGLLKDREYKQHEKDGQGGGHLVRN